MEQKKALEQFNPKVEVRYDFLVGDRIVTGEEEISRLFLKKVDQVAVESSLKDLIERLIGEFAFRDLKLLQEEFVSYFNKLQLPERLTDRFIDDYREKDSQEESLVRSLQEAQGISAETQETLYRHLEDKVDVFLDQNKLNSANTFFEFLQAQKHRYPYLLLSRVFTNKIKAKLVSKIRENCQEIATRKYLHLLNDDKEGFVLSFMMGRVIKIDLRNRTQEFDPKAFRILLEFLDQMGTRVESIDGENLFGLLQEESLNMAHYLEVEKETAISTGVRSRVFQIEDELSVGDKRARYFFDPDFDMRDFYNQNILPELFVFNSDNLEKLGEVRMIDLFGRDEVAFKGVIFSLQHVMALKDLVNLFEKDPHSFMRYLMDLLGYDYVLEEGKLDLKEVRGNIEKALELSEKMIKKNISDALSYREPEDPIHVDCQYFEEILQIRNPAELLKILAAPEDFKTRYPKFQGTPDEVVRYQAQIMLSHFLFVEGKYFENGFAKVREKRKVLEDYFKEAWEIRDCQKVQVVYRILERLDQEGKKTNDFELIFDRDSKQFGESFLPAEVTNLLREDETDELVYQNQCYLVYPQEVKDFMRVRMTVPYWEKNPESGLLEKKSREMTVLIYSGDGNLIHSKDDIQMLLSMLKKQVSDENRWLIVCENEEDIAAIKSFLYGRDPRSVIKVDDQHEGRKFSTKREPRILSGSSKDFKDGEYLHLASRIGLLSKQDGKLVRVTAPLETQVQGLRHNLIYNVSQYTNSGHPKYRAKRAWQMMNLYFDPYVWGERYQGYKEQGYSYKLDQ